MRLLFEQNLAPRLVATLGDTYPGSRHVEDVGLARASDSAVWHYAKENGFAIVSKDSDLQQLSFLERPQRSSGSIKANARSRRSRRSFGTAWT